MAFILFFYYLFWLCWVFVAASGLSQVGASTGYSSLRCAGFLIVVASLVAEHGLYGTQASVVAARRLSSCGART